MREPNDRLPLPVLASLILLLIGALYAADKFLAKLETREVDAQARHLFESGQKLLAVGKAEDAIHAFEAAHVLQRGNEVYILAMASAQLTDGRVEAARSALADLLAARQNDARANLLMARVSSAQGRFEEADSFYHRSIYGAWSRDAERNRLNARLELAEMLAGRGLREELLSETLFLRGSNLSGGNRALSLRIAELFVRAGSANRAVEVYRSMLTEHPIDAEAEAGLGEAELTLGDFRAAEAAFRRALSRTPGNARAAARAKLASDLVKLDPTPRRLRSEDKFRRSEEILRMTVEASACARNSVGVAERAEAAARLLNAKVRPPFSNEMSEDRLSAAEKLWTYRLQRCRTLPEANEPVAILMRKLMSRGQ